jgi:hypothetical protein
MIDGTPIPSVSAVLSVMDKNLETWWRTHGFEKCDQIMKESVEFGESVQGAIECLLRGQPIPQEGDLPRIIEAFKAWSRENISKWLGLEVGILNKSYRYGGTADAFAVDKEGNLVIIDFKATKQVRETHYLQVAAYMFGEELIPGEKVAVDLKKVKRGIILHLDKDSMAWRSYPLEDPENLFEVFKACRLIYKWKNGI